MGTGGATALGSPELCAELSAQSSGELRFYVADCRLVVSNIDIHTFKEHRLQSFNLKSAIFNCRFSDIYIQEEEFDLNELRFVLRSFDLLRLRLRKDSESRNRKVKDQAERVISTPELNTLLCLHPEPINVVVYHDPSGRSHLGIGLALRCFQRLSFPNIATQHCR